MIDVSALRRLLLTVTSWLDGQEREIVAYGQEFLAAVQAELDAAATPLSAR